MENFRQLMELIGTAIDGLGVFVVVIGVVIASGRCLFVTLRRARQDAFRSYRQDIGRAILLGLEFLVAGDIIRTVAVSPTIENAMALGLIVLIRTFLSMSLQVELEGRWPWQSRRRAGQEAHSR